MAIAVCVLLALCLLSPGDHSSTDWAALYRKAQEFYAQADYDSSNRCSERGYDYWRTRSDSNWHWQFRLLLAETLLEVEQYERAEALLKDAAGTLDLEKRRLADLGILQYRRRDFDHAASTLAAAETVNVPVAPELSGKIEMTLGMIYLKQERFELAESEFRRAIDTLAGSGSVMRSYALNDVGLVYQKQFRWDEALPWFQQAEREAQKLGARRAEMLAVGNLGITYLSMGDSDRALKFYNSALAISERIHDRSDQQIWLLNIGNVHADLHDLDAASRYYRKAWSLVGPDGDVEVTAKIMENLTNLALASGDFKTAEQWNAQAAVAAGKVNTKFALAAVELKSALIAAGLHQHAEAEAHFHRAVEINREAHRPMEEWECHSGLAALYRDWKKPAEADAEYRRAIAVIEQERSKIGGAEHRITFLSKLIEFYQGYVDFLVERGENSRAFDVAASARARVLAERIGHPELNEATVVRRLQNIATSSRAVLMSYWLAPKRSFLWVINASGLQSFILPGEEAISSHVKHWRDAILDGKDPRVAAPDNGRWLFENLVSSHYRVPAGSRVVIAPDNSLYSLNFETLPAGDNGEYWIRNVDITVAPSLALLRPVEEPAPGRLLLIADPDFSSNEFPRLTNAKREIETVSKHFPARDVYEDSKATARAYLDAPVSSYSTIHFAAHAVASRDNPLDSAIILSGPRQNHKLYARDVMSRPLHADLVTLSACQTAGAKTYSGEGLTGLAWAFLSAGARNVVAGLWDVDDRATAEMMSRFYDSISQGRTPAQSLREAKLSLIDSPGVLRKPVYWAAFETFTRALYVNRAPGAALARSTAPRR